MNIDNLINFLFENENFSIKDIPKEVTKSVVDFKSYISSLSREQLISLQNELDILAKEYDSKFRNMKTLFHGSTNKNIEKIKKDGFKLTDGQRVGLFGDVKSIQNLAIFLSDDKSLAAGYGAYKDEYGGSESGVIQVKADINKTLDFTKWGSHIPESIRKIALEKISKYEGKKITKPRKLDVFWFMDQPEIVKAIKSEGYDSVRLAETAGAKKALGLDKTSGDTIAVFDPSKLHVYMPPTGMQGLYNYIKYTL